MLFAGTRVCNGFLVWWAARGDDDDDDDRAMISTMTNATSNAMGRGTRALVGRGRSVCSGGGRGRRICPPRDTIAVDGRSVYLVVTVIVVGGKGGMRSPRRL
jgi:hypothetical protein